MKVNNNKVLTKTLVKVNNKVLAKKLIKVNNNKLLIKNFQIKCKF